MTKTELYLAKLNGDYDGALPPPNTKVEIYLYNLVKNGIVQDDLEISISQKVAEEVAKIVAGAPEDFDTLKEMSDWLLEHEDSAAAMNSEIQELKTSKADISDTLMKSDIVTLTREEYDSLSEKTALYYFIREE